MAGNLGGDAEQKVCFAVSSAPRSRRSQDAYSQQATTPHGTHRVLTLLADGYSG